VHCGCYIGNGQVIHCEERHNTVAQELADLRARRRLLGVYRHNRLAMAGIAA
jgi:hypothetical protein